MAAKASFIRFGIVPGTVTEVLILYVLYQQGTREHLVLIPYDVPASEFTAELWVNIQLAVLREHGIDGNAGTTFVAVTEHAQGHTPALRFHELSLSAQLSRTPTGKIPREVERDCISQAHIVGEIYKRLARAVQRSAA